MLRRENEDLQKRNRELEAKVAELTAAVSLKSLLEFINSAFLLLQLAKHEGEATQVLLIDSEMGVITFHSNIFHAGRHIMIDSFTPYTLPMNLNNTPIRQSYTIAHAHAHSTR